MSKNSALIFLLLTSLIWGVTIPILKLTLVQVPVFTLAFLRFAIASSLTLPLLKDINLPKKDYFSLLLVVTAGITLSISLLFLGLKKTTATDSSIIISLGPLISSILAFFYLNERISKIHIAGILISFLGAILIIFEPLLTSNYLNGSIVGNFLILGSVLTASLFEIGSKKLFTEYKPMTIIVFSFFLSTLAFLPLAIFEYIYNPNWVNNINSIGIFGILFVGIFSSAFSYSIREWILAVLPIHILSLSTYLILVVAVIYSAVLLGEKVSQNFIPALILILIGVFLGTYNKHEHHKKKSL